MNATVSFLAPPRTGTGQPAAGAPGGAPRSVVRVPATSVHGGAVFVVENGRALRRAVTVGLGTTGGEVEVRSGLIGGEDLIVAPPETLKDGDRVRITEPAK
jgi:hypothetical protein